MHSSATATQREAVQVIMDSNALFTPLQFKIDLFAELERILQRRFELVLLSQVRHELEILASEGSPKTRRMAAFALKFAENCKYIDAKPSVKTTDDAIIEVAAKFGMVVFTNDSQLRRRLRDISVPVIYVRQKSHLEIEGMI